MMLQENPTPTEAVALAETSPPQDAATASPVILDWSLGHDLLDAATWLGVLALVSVAVFFVVRYIALRALSAFAKRAPTKWGEVFYKQRALHRLTWATPAIIIFQGVKFIPALPTAGGVLLQRLALGLLAIITVRAFAGALMAANEIYSLYPRAKERPIKGYLQVASITAHILAIVVFVAALTGQSPLVLFSGLGALTAVFMLVFRDSLLSLVAGIQITTNDLVRVGDWIEMPQFLADGDVTDIALNSVSVQNWDKTITVIPTHKFLENSFKNWRGMQQSGGRRIKRSIHIDIGTIRFLTDEEIERFGKFELLRDYMAEKKREIAEHNAEKGAAAGTNAHSRRLTNIGTLRAYMTRYLRQHPGINQDMFLLVRQLQPTGEGLPIEIYGFSNDVRWAFYEGTQADIFDHILAKMPEFGLRVYQAPSSYDFGRVLGAAEAHQEERRAIAPAGGHHARGERLSAGGKAAG